MVEKHGGNLSVRKACDLVNVRRQGYYEWKQRRDGKRERQDRALTVKIKDIFYESNRIYGARKICALLARIGWRVSRKRVRRLMLIEGLVPVTFRKRVNTTDSKHELGIFPNLLQQDFRVALPNKAWVSDFTYIPTDEGWLYLCSIIDLFHRGVVGWAVSSTIDRKLAIAALENAVKNRKPGRGLIFHTDRGCQYASGDFRNAVASIGGIQSMSRSGTPYDNACAETFFKTIKVECLNRRHFETRTAAESAVMMYILFYNRVRIHQSLEYLSPVAFEEAYSA
jgi:transposase InsO family protein